MITARDHLHGSIKLELTQLLTNCPNGWETIDAAKWLDLALENVLFKIDHNAEETAAIKRNYDKYFDESGDYVRSK